MLKPLPFLRKGSGFFSADENKKRENGDRRINFLLILQTEIGTFLF